MGPNNIALVTLFRADQALRHAQGSLDSASSSVRTLQRRIADLSEKQKLLTQRLRESQSQANQLDLDIKARSEHIEKLRTQQQNAKNNKEYQAFLTEINAEKEQREKVEEEALKSMEAVEKLQGEGKELAEALAAEQARHAKVSAEVSEKLAALQADVERLRPIRDAAAEKIAPRALNMYSRMAERYEGEAMGAISKPDRRREEYVCSACNMDLVADVYNKLHSRDEPIECPNCRRLLFIPADLPPEAALNTPKDRPTLKPSARELAAAVGRQTSAADISRSISAQDDEDQPAAEDLSAPAADSASADSAADVEGHAQAESAPASDADAPADSSTESPASSQHQTSDAAGQS